MTTPNPPPRLGNYLICAVCARPGTGHGYAPSDRHTVAWLCDDPDCIPIARTTYAMRQDKFRRIDSLAAVEGGNSAGEYLDEIGVYELDKLEPEQWSEFCRRLVGGYRVALVTTLREESPF